MGIFKFQATQLFNGYQFLDDSYVLVTDEKGVVQEIIDKENAGEDVQQFEGILSPGFVNAHCHLELSHLKGLIPEHTGLVDFVFTVVTQRHLPEEEIAAAITRAEDEMLANGIVAVGDICNNTSTIFQKQRSRLAYYNFIEASGWVPQVAVARFERSKGFYDAFSPLQMANFKLSMAPHAPYSVSNELWKMIAPYFNGKITTIHNQETVAENDLFRKGSGDFLRMYEKMNIDNSFFVPTGSSGLQSSLPKLKTAKQVLLVHNTFTTEEDMLFAGNQPMDISWCLCINANQYIENALPPIELLRKNRCKIVLGTDSLASNHSLSILDEMKTITKHFPSIPVSELLQWATLNGAKALGMENQFGSFEKGKKPGVLMIEGLSNDKLQEHSTVRRLL